MGEKKIGVLIDKIPARINPAQTLKIIHNSQIDARHIVAIKELSSLSDADISYCLNFNVKTFRKYRDEKTPMSPNLKEHTVMLLALMKHGLELFGTGEKFSTWLKTENFFFDKRPPLEYLDKISGILFVDDRLTAMEFGDNV